jgi:hypothetical protein
MRGARWMSLLLVVAACNNSGSGANGNGGNGGNGSGGYGVGGNGSGSPNQCPSSPGGALIADALCVCGDLHDIGNLVVDASSATASGAIGVDGLSTLANHLDASGSFVAYAGLDDIGDTVVHHDLLTSANVAVAGNLEVDHDLGVGGNLSGVGRVAVDGTLRIGGANQMLGWQQVAARGPFSATPSPCPCGASQIFDVDGAIAAAKASSSTTVLSSGPSGTIGVNEMSLGTGVYYLADAATIGYSKLHVTGAVSLYVDGTIDDIGADKIVIDSGASLDMYVSGSVNTIGYAGLGDKSAPANFTLYLGGDAPVTLSIGAQWFHGSIYAPRARIGYVGDTNIAGGLFVDELAGTGNLVIGGQLPFSTGNTQCPPTPPMQPPVDNPTPPIS